MCVCVLVSIVRRVWNFCRSRELAKHQLQLQIGTCTTQLTKYPFFKSHTKDYPLHTHRHTSRHTPSRRHTRATRFYLNTLERTLGPLEEAPTMKVKLTLNSCRRQEQDRHEHDSEGTPSNPFPGGSTSTSNARENQ